MELNIKATAEEKELVVRSIRKINKVIHIKHMSQAMIAEDSGVKASKVRIALQDLMDDGHIEQIVVSDKAIKRYYYVLTDKGNETYLQ